MWRSAVQLCLGLRRGGLAQLARAPALQAGGQRFESVILHLCGLSGSAFRSLTFWENEKQNLQIATRFRIPSHCGARRHVMSGYADTDDFTSDAGSIRNERADASAPVPSVLPLPRGGGLWRMRVYGGQVSSAARGSRQGHMVDA